MLACVAVLGLVVLAGCGSSSNNSSKPAYCSARTKLEKSLSGVTDLSATSSISSLESAFSKAKSQADAAITDAKGDFSKQTAALKSSVDALSKDVKALKADASVANISAVTSGAEELVTAVSNFVSATKAKCG